VYVLAIALRVLWVVSFDPLPLADWKWFVDRAGEMVAGNGYAVDGEPTAYWPVGYPAFLAALFALFGQSLLVVETSQIALSVAIMALTIALCRQAFPDGRIAALSAMLLAIYPDYVAVVVLPYNELLFTAGLLLTHALMRGSSRPLMSALAAGVVFGGICLIKPQILFVPLAILTTRTWLLGRAWHPVIVQAVALYVAALAFLMPWTLRNYLVFETLVLVSTNDGVNLFIGNNPDANGQYTYTPAMRERIRRELPDTRGLSVQQRELAADEVQRRIALQYMAQHPMQLLSGIPAKLRNSFLRSGDPFVQIKDGLNSRLTGGARSLTEWQHLTLWRAGQVNQLFYLAALGTFVAIGAGMAWRSVSCHRAASGRSDELLFAESGMIVLYFAAVSAIFFGLPRFSMPLIPYLLIALSYALLACHDTIARFRQWDSKA
jgi:hypothetical protein